MKTNYQSIGKSITMQVSLKDFSKFEKIEILLDLLQELGIEKFYADKSASEGFVAWFDSVISEEN